MEALTNLNGMIDTTRGLNYPNNQNNAGEIKYPDELTFESAVELIRAVRNVPHWVYKAREEAKDLRALIDGTNFSTLLIHQIEKIESKSRAVARKKYVKDVRSLFKRVLSNRSNVFESDGGSEEVDISSEAIKKEFIYHMNHFKGGKSVKHYLSSTYLQLWDKDPNGVLFLEYRTGDKQDVYPTYKAIEDLRFYGASGQRIEVIVFEPRKLESGQLEWRVVDKNRDFRIMETADVFVENTELSFDHPFGVVPGLVISPEKQVGSEQRMSAIDSIIEDAKDYCQLKSVRTIYRYQKGAPIHWRVKSENRVNAGMNRTGNGDKQTDDLQGATDSQDVTDIVKVPPPMQDQPNYLPNIAGYISPDLEFLKHMDESLESSERSMLDTFWGTTNATIEGVEKTATQTNVDVQPITNVLDTIATTVEWVHNFFGNLVANFVYPTKNKDEKVFHISYGRRFIIESPDVVLQRYQEALKSSCPATVLDKMLEEWIVSKYKNDPYMQEFLLKKFTLEPYPHWDIQTVNTIFGVVEALTKAAFEEFWKQKADPKLTIDKLQEQLNKYTDEYINRKKVPAAGTNGGGPVPAGGV
jgi:hypothetical protein